MKILYLTDQTYLHGGIEKVLSQKANYLSDFCGDEVTIVTYKQQKMDSVYPINSKIRRIDLGINYVIATSYFAPVNLKKIPQHIKKIKETIAVLKPDVIISCSFGPDFYFLPFITDIPVIKEFHSSRYFSSKEHLTGMKFLLQKLTEYIETKYAALVVLNADEVSFYHSAHISVIPNPTELSAQSTPLDKKQILAAGRISPVKNFGDLIDAFKGLSDRFPNWQLHFWGEDYVGTRAVLQKKIDSLGLQNQLRFMGTCPDLKQEMPNYSICVMTSETECFPMVLLESLSAGLPVVSYDSPTGPRHIVKDAEDGFIVPYKNLDIFTKKLEKLMSDDNLRQEMGSKGTINMQRFDIDKIMSQWHALFRKVKDR